MEDLSTGSDHICVQTASARGDHKPRLCTRTAKWGENAGERGREQAQGHEPVST